MVDTDVLDIDSKDYASWVDQWYPDWEEFFQQRYHKKLLEFYISFSLLTPEENDTFMDAAGGQKSYIFKTACSRKIIQDIRISTALKVKQTDDIEFIEGNASAIALEDGSVNKISCHHSFEHFQKNADSEFIGEVQRILAPGGKCCIVPLFLTSQYTEITDSLNTKLHFDPLAKFIIEPTATLPGGNSCGNFARTYDLAALSRRVLDGIDSSKFTVQIVECRMDNQAIPEMTLRCHRGVSALNYPYRALLITRDT